MADDLTTLRRAFDDLAAEVRRLNRDLDLLRNKSSSGIGDISFLVEGLEASEIANKLESLERRLRD